MIDGAFHYQNDALLPTETANALRDEIGSSRWGYGRDYRRGLMELDGTPEDKAAVAEVFGGPGAGAEFLR